jgi:Bacterial Ig-like domain (group 3)
VSFVIGGNSTSVPLSGGVATLTISTLPGGSDTITANYSGDANFNTSAASITQNVNKAPSSTILESNDNPSNFGQTVTLSALVQGGGTLPTGTVTFTDTTTNTTLGTATISGATQSNNFATLSIATLAVGTHNITATYSGDGNFNGSTGTLSQQVNKGTATISVTSSPNPSVSGQAVTVTATVSATAGPGIPGGSVTFSINGTPLSGGPVTLSGGKASFTTTFSAGQFVINAVYGGDNNFLAITTPASDVQNVSQATTTTLTSSPNPSTPGQAVTFTATVKPTAGSGTPTGTVTFKDGGTTIGTVTLNASDVASFTTSTLALGSHSITAVYGGQAPFAPSTSNTLVQNVTNSSSDSVKLRELQVSATPIIANAWAQSVTAAMDDAVTTGFSGNPRSLSPAGTGLTYYFDGDAPAQAHATSDQDSLQRFLASPNGGSPSQKRVDDDFGALGYAPMATKAPPPALAAPAPRDWLGWINVRGTDFYRGTFGDDLKGEQVDAIAGLTRRLTSNFVVGVLGGYEPLSTPLNACEEVGNCRPTSASMPAPHGPIFLPMTLLERPAATSSARVGS